MFLINSIMVLAVLCAMREAEVGDSLGEWFAFICFFFLMIRGVFSLNWRGLLSVPMRLKGVSHL